MITGESVRDILDKIGYEVFDYSGRYMYGDKCPAIKSEDNVAKLLSNIINSVLDEEFDDDEKDILREMFDNVRTDSLGLGIVIYFPKFIYQEE